MPRSAWCWTCWTGSTSSKPRSATRPERGSEPRMDMNRLTQKSQAAMQEAQALAVRHGHTEVDGEHLLLALLDQPEGLLPRLVTQLGADPAALRVAVETDVRRKPKVTGPKGCGTRRSSPWTWARWWPAPSTAGSSRSGSRPYWPR